MIKVPGKLMIAGEFAVLEPRHKLIAMAVDRFVYATLIATEENQITLENLELFEAVWEYKENKVEIKTKDPRVRFVQFAMEVALNYLEEQSVSPERFSLTIKSELNDESGIKYGLGSSAAVVTAVIKAVLEHHLPASPSADLVFRLAAISHVITQGNGSGADIAASSYGGIIEYTSFQAEWLLEAYRNKQNLTELVLKEWVHCSIKRVSLPRNLHILIGWTGKPASTSQLVKKTLGLKMTDPEKFHRFLDHSKMAVECFLTGTKEENISLVLKGVEENRQALSDVGNDACVEIETALLAKLADLAKQFGGAGKLSGAGGGDCGIAFVESKEKYNQLKMAFEDNGIKPLTIEPYYHGATVIT